MPYTKVKDNVYAITDGSTYGNIGAFVLPSQIVFIDSGMNIPKITEFRRNLERETGKKTSTLILTHYHSDHIFGNQIFSDCKIYSSTNTKQAMIENLEKDWNPENLAIRIKRSEDPSALENLKIILPNNTFSSRIEIWDYDVKLVLKQTGGHTSGSTYVFCPNYKVLAAGDNLFINMFPWGGDSSANPQVWLKTLKEYLALDVDLFIPGHGPICNKNKVKEYADYLELITITMLKMIAQGKRENSVLETCAEIAFYPPKREEWKSATLKKWYEELSKKTT